MKRKVAEGIHLFNSQKFFEAHEALEEVWLISQGKEKLFLHGLIQVAAAFHHHSRGNPAGFRSLLKKGMGKLNQFGDVKDGVDLAGLRRQIQRWQNSPSDGQLEPSAPNVTLPKIRRKRQN
jgi:predicted metal-dependent hydrolase